LESTKKQIYFASSNNEIKTSQMLHLHTYRSQILNSKPFGFMSQDDFGKERHRSGTCVSRNQMRKYS